MLNGYRKMVTDAGRDAKRQMIVIRANSKVTDAPLERRPPLSGSIDQILDDLRWLLTLEIHTVFFDLNMSYTPVDDQLRYMEQLQKGLSAA